jgi:lipopolysaccharide cholinephosphotransferase
MLNGTTLIHNGMQSYDIHQGIYIDVFMINGIADGKIRGKIQRKALLIKRRLLRKYYAIEVKNERPVNWVRLIPEVLRRPIISLMEKLSDIDPFCCKHCYGNDHPNISMAPIYSSNMFLPKDKIKLRFEDSEFFGPKNYKKFLEITFGDWQKLPPENQRVNHNNCVVDFENDYSKYINK